MTPAARVQAAIELLDEVIAATAARGAAADVLAARYFKQRRYAGSKDRRAINDLVWRAIRAFGPRPASGRAAMVALADDDQQLAALFDGVGHAPKPITADEPRAARAPVAGSWGDQFYDGIDAAEIDALMARAPLDLRLKRGVPIPADWRDICQPLHPLLNGCRFDPPVDVSQHPLVEDGAAEVQDEGSQWIARLADARPGATVVDLCAGGGGKTLALADAMGGHGRLIACDVDRSRLQRLPPRAGRAGVDGIELRLLDPGRESAALADLAGRCDLVLIDAPCSGTGTWRRNPEARWRDDQRAFARLCAEQARLIDIGASLVAPGGALVYAVCALTRAEGQEQVEQFLAREQHWRASDAWQSGALPHGKGRPVGPGLILTPAHDGCDGFFMARLTR